MTTPFLSLADARSAGIPRRTLASDAYTRLMRDCYVAAEVTITHELLVRAALRTVPGATFACLNSAADLWKAVVPDPCVPHVGGTDARRSVRDEVRFRQYKATPELRKLRGIPLTSPAQTFLDLAGSLGFVDLLVLGDSLIHRTDLTAAALRAAAAEFRGNRRRLAVQTADMCRDRVESASETKSRLLIVSAGLPEPQTNFIVRMPDERFRRIDLAYPELKLAIEYDGRHHIQREEQWEHDILRREDLEKLGWRFVVITSDDLYRKAAATLVRVADAIAARSGTRPTIGPGWRQYFPQASS